jgi:hypothetical protein
MSNDERRRNEIESEPQGKRSGRDGISRQQEPSEFADDMRVNRFEPPPEPESDAKN